MIRILYMTAAWCGPCRSFGPLLTREAEARGLKVERVNIDEDTTTPRVWGIQSVPTVIITRPLPGHAEEVVDRFGALPASALRDRLDALTGGGH